MKPVVRLAIRLVARALVRRRLVLSVDGTLNVPHRGPVLIVARHYHNLYDGCILLAAVPRPLSFLVALDWVRTRPMRVAMERACRAARWPVVLREVRTESAYRPDERRAWTRRGLREAVAVLRGGGALVIFPEAYPNEDPVYTPKADPWTFLPFRPGFAHLADVVEGVAVVPVGVAYVDENAGRRQVRLRVGPSLARHAGEGRAAFVRRVEEAVRHLSAPL